MQLHQIECFIAVTQWKSFSKAANALYMTAPGVTKQINALEQSLGLRLFERDNRGVTLTEAGKAFYLDAVKLMDFANQAVHHVQELAKVIQSRIVLGVVLPSQRMISICKAYNEQSKLQATLCYQQITSFDALEALMNKTIDCFIQLGRPLERPGVCCELLYRSELQCIANAHHPLARKEKIKLSDLRGEVLVLPPAGHLEYFDNFRAFLKENYPDIIVNTMKNAVSTYMAIEMNQVFSVTTIIRGLSNPAFCYKPIDTQPWDQRIEICLMRRDEKNPFLDEFIQIAKENIKRAYEKEA